MAIKIYESLEQGSDEWLAARCGLLTASEMKLIITPSNLKAANNDKSRAHLYELLAQRITGHVEPHYFNDDMLRGQEDEIDARDIYSDEYAEVTQVGFVTNDKWGFTLGYSPDGLVDFGGAIEVKSRRQKYQIETILSSEVPDEYMIQLQTGILVAELDWIDFISYSAGLPMLTLRVLPNQEIQEAIIAAATLFHEKLNEKLEEYENKLKNQQLRLIPTERKIYEEIIV